MRRLLPIAALAVFAATCSAPASSRAEGPEVRNRLSAGLVLQAPHHAGPSLRLLVRERFGAVVRDRDGLRVSLGFDGRAGLRLLQGRLDDFRIQDASVRFEGAKGSIALGRVRLEGGGWRLVDGAVALLQPTPGLRVGGWVGAVPDPWTTSPAPRFGGGPMVLFDHRVVQARFVGEVAGGPPGLERLGAAASVRAEAGRWFEASARADLQHGGPGRGLLAADLGVSARGRPVEDVRLDLFWSAWAGQAWLQGVARDPWLSRFAARYEADLDPADVGEARDLTLRHLVGFTASFDPRLPGDLGPRLTTGARLRVRPGTPADRYARLSGWAGLRGLAAGRLDVVADGGAVLWGGAWRADLGASVWFEPHPDVPLALDVSARLGLERRPDGTVAPMVYADLFVDALLGRGVSLSAGYRFTNDLDTDRWNAAHAGLLKITWRLKVTP